MREGAGIFFTDGEHVLLLKKGNEWELPGGGLKKDESKLQTAQREAKEECGYLKGKKIYKYEEENWTLFFYKVKKPFECKISEEHEDYKWILISELKNKKLHKKLKKNLEKYIIIIENNFKNLSFKKWININKG